MARGRRVVASKSRMTILFASEDENVMRVKSEVWPLMGPEVTSRITFPGIEGSPVASTRVDPSRSISGRKPQEMLCLSRSGRYADFQREYSEMSDVTLGLSARTLPLDHICFNKNNERLYPVRCSGLRIALLSSKAFLFLQYRLKMGRRWRCNVTANTNLYRWSNEVMQSQRFLQFVCGCHLWSLTFARAQNE